MTMSLVQTVTVGAGGAAAIEFSNIPSTAKDLLLICTIRADNSDYNALMYLQFNDTTSTYTNRRLFGTGSSSGSGRNNLYPIIAVNGTTSVATGFSANSIYITNYAGTNAKTITMEDISTNTAADASQVIQAGGWSGTSAITKIKIFRSEFNILQHSSVSLYAIS